MDTVTTTPTGSPITTRALMDGAGTNRSLVPSGAVAAGAAAHTGGASLNTLSAPPVTPATSEGPAPAALKLKIRTANHKFIVLADPADTFANLKTVIAQQYMKLYGPSLDQDSTCQVLEIRSAAGCPQRVHETISACVTNGSTLSVLLQILTSNALLPVTKLPAPGPTAVGEPAAGSGETVVDLTTLAKRGSHYSAAAVTTVCDRLLTQQRKRKRHTGELCDCGSPKCVLARQAQAYLAAKRNNLDVVDAFIAAGGRRDAATTALLRSAPVLKSPAEIAIRVQRHLKTQLENLQKYAASDVRNMLDELQREQALQLKQCKNADELLVILCLQQPHFGAAIETLARAYLTELRIELDFRSCTSLAEYRAKRMGVLAGVLYELGIINNYSIFFA